MNKKGFTLIELIITIGLMLMVGIVISTNMLGLFSHQEENDYEDFVKKIEESACVYVETVMSSSERTSCKQNSCIISIDKLINSGYVDENLVDPSTGESVKNNSKYSVNVSWVNNKKTCKIRG